MNVAVQVGLEVQEQYECYSSGRFRGSGVTAEGHMHVTVQVGLEVQ